MRKSINLFTALALLFLLANCQSNKSEDQQQEEESSSTFESAGQIEKIEDQLDQLIAPGTLPQIIAEGFDCTD